MAYLNRRTFIASALAASTATTALGRSQPWAEELSAYSVRDPMAGYFNFAKRRKLIQTVVDPVLQAARVKLIATPSCAEVLAIPVQDQAIVLPSFYENNEAWRSADDELFRNGVGAIYSALTHATPEGAMPLEMKRGELAAHYQNFALMYLAMIAEIAERQGYRMWDLEVDGKTLHHLVDVNNRIIADPAYVTRCSGVDEVSLRYRKDNQYFAWFEIYLARFGNSEMEAWIADRRPLYNRSLGGHMTVYFYTPR